MHRLKSRVLVSLLQDSRDLKALGFLYCTKRALTPSSPEVIAVACDFHTALYYQFICMKRAGNLIEHIADIGNLYYAFYKAKKGKHSKKDVLAFQRNLDENILLLRSQILNGNVDVGDYHFFTIYDPKQRVISAAPFEQRVLHHAIMNVCHSYFERHLIDDSYATRVGKGTYSALYKAYANMKHYRYCAKLDVRKYFDSISHSVLKQCLRSLFKDVALLKIFDRIIDSYSSDILTSGGSTSAFLNDSFVEKGIPIGNLTSQYFANFYLSGLDHYIKEVLRIPFYIRYMDDMLLLENDKEKLQRAVSAVQLYVQQMLNLELKPIVFTRTITGVSFLGYKLYPHKILLNKRSKRRYLKKRALFLQWLSDGSSACNAFEIESISKVMFCFERHAYMSL